MELERSARAEARVVFVAWSGVSGARAAMLPGENSPAPLLGFPGHPVGVGTFRAGPGWVAGGEGSVPALWDRRH